MSNLQAGYLYKDIVNAVSMSFLDVVIYTLFVVALFMILLYTGYLIGLNVQRNRYYQATSEAHREQIKRAVK